MLPKIGPRQEELEKSMSLHIMLVDLENVSRFSISDVPAGSKVHIVLNPSQGNKALSLVEDAKRRGLPPVECYVIQTSGRNAADFVLSCKLGELLTTNPHAQFVIVSNDRGFDALVTYLVAKGVKCQRMGYAPPDSTSSHGKRRSSSKSVKKPLTEEELYRLVVRRLWQMSRRGGVGSGLPTTKKKLANFLANCINGDPLLRQANVVEQIIRRLIADGHVRLQKHSVTRLSYQFPKLTTGQSQGTKQQPSMDHQLV